MTKYIKTKDGKFAGSIGAGKSTVPTAAPALPTTGVLAGEKYPDTPTSTTPDAIAPVSSPRAQDFPNFIEAHARAWFFFAENGSRPSAIHHTDFDGNHPLAQNNPAITDYLTHIHSPSDVEELTEQLRDQPAQQQVLSQLCDLGDDLEQLAELVRGNCYECESLEGEGFCPLHTHVGNTDIDDFITDTLPDAREAVEKDFLPMTGHDPEAAAVAATLLPNPFSPRPSDAY